MTADIASLEGLGGRFQLLRLQATERLGELPEFDLELFSPSVGEDLRACLGEFVCVSVPKCDGELRYFNGIIIQISRIGAYARGEKIRAKISTRLWLATRNRECRIFEGMSVPDIVTEILTARQLIVAAERLDSARYQPWDYLVQYRESDFDFISRILAHEGIYYYFRYLETSHELVLADSMASHDAIAQYDVLPIIPASNRTHNRDRITGISQQFSSRGAKSTLQAHDFRLRYGTDLVVHGLKTPGLHHGRR